MSGLFLHPEFNLFSLSHSAKHHLIRHDRAQLSPQTAKSLCGCASLSCNPIFSTVDNLVNCNICQICLHAYISHLKAGISSEFTPDATVIQYIECLNDWSLWLDSLLKRRRPWDQLLFCAVYDLVESDDFLEKYKYRDILYRRPDLPEHIRMIINI